MNQPSNAHAPLEGSDTAIDSMPPKPLLVDRIILLYRHRRKLALYSVVLAALGILGFSLWYLAKPKIVEGTVRLNFQGIEVSQYPSGKQFSVEDFRSPGILTKALADATISSERISLQDLAAHLFVTPVVPSDVEGRWKKQELAGQKKEEYSPNEFKISIEVKGLSDREQLRLFHALISRYQESVKYEQYSAKGFAPSAEFDYEKLVGVYDPWDIPDIYREAYKSMHGKLDDVIAESTRFQDSSYQLAFREIAKDLDTWERTRLQGLEALTYEGHLVRNRDMVAQRIRYRIQDLSIHIQRTEEEAKQAVKLLEVIVRPQPILAGQLSNKDNVPLIDADTLEKLLKSDYVGPVVERISKLQTHAQSMEIEKARLEKQLGWLTKDSISVSQTMPPKESVAILSKELGATTGNYNRLLENYLSATITSLISVRQSPMISRTRYSPVLIVCGILLLGVFFAILLLMAQSFFEKIREQS